MRCPRCHSDRLWMRPLESGTVICLQCGRQFPKDEPKKEQKPCAPKS